MNIHNAVERALATLEFLAKTEKPATLTEICTYLNAPKTSMNPIIYTLVMKKFIAHNKINGTYSLGPANYKLGNQYMENLDYLKYIRQVMESVVHKCSETCFFATLQGGNIVYLMKVDSPEKIRMVSSIGTVFPAYATSLGKAMLSQYDINYIKSLYPEGLKAFSNKTITSFAVLEKQLNAVRNNGYAEDNEESDENVCCRAVPIINNNKIIAALSVSTPTFRFSKEKEALVIASLKQGKYDLEQIFRNNQIDLTTLI